VVPALETRQSLGITLAELETFVLPDDDLPKAVSEASPAMLVLAEPGCREKLDAARARVKELVPLVQEHQRLASFLAPFEAALAATEGYEREVSNCARRRARAVELQQMCAKMKREGVNAPFPSTTPNLHNYKTRAEKTLSLLEAYYSNMRAVEAQMK